MSTPTLREAERIWRNFIPQLGSTFPKVCGKCGSVYNSLDELRERTRNCGLSATDLAEEEDEAFQVCVAGFRNCSCGSTLMLLLRDRRDTSPEGQERRAIFGKILRTLVQADWPEDEARQFLLNHIHQLSTKEKSPLRAETY